MPNSPEFPKPWPCIAAAETFLARATSWPILAISAWASLPAPVLFSALVIPSMRVKANWPALPWMFTGSGKPRTCGAIPPAAKCDEDDWGIPPNPGTW